jgi:hypothetical protein
MMQNMMKSYEERNKVMMDEFIKVRQERDEIAELLKKGVKNESTPMKEESVSRKVEKHELTDKMIHTPLKNEADEKLKPTSSVKMTTNKTNNSSKKVAGNFKDDRNDEEVMESESDDEAHEYKSYVEWLLKREKLYPFDRKPSLYKHRCTLLSYNGRVCEYYRFGCLVDFNPSLYPYQYRRWFLRYLTDKGEYKPTTTIRPVDMRTLEFPNWNVNDDEVRIVTRNNDDPDIPPHSSTLSLLPSVLQVDPPAKSIYHIDKPTLIKIVDRYRYQLSILKSGKSTDNNRTYSSSSSSKSVKSELHSHSHADLPALERSDTSSYVTPHAQLKLSNYPSVSPSVAYSNSDQYVSMIKREEQVVEDTHSNSSEFVSLRDKSVLGSILECFDDGTRAMILATRQTREMTATEINKQVSQVSAKIPKFNGNAEKAPAYLLELCQEVARVPFNHSDVIMIMSNTMSETAKEWLTSKIIDLAKIPDDMKIPTLLGAYRDQYMNVNHVISYQERLNSLKLSDTNVTISDLRQHYTAFNKLKNNLRLCDKHISEESMRRQYVTSLPSKIRNYIGVAYKQCYSIDAIHQLAEEACRSNQPKHRLDNDEGVVNLNVIESYTTHDEHELSDEYDTILEKDVQHMWFMALSMTRSNLSKSDVVCWHCGNRGHYAGECQINIKGLPQTPKGAAYYASFNRMRGEVRPYNAQAQKDRQEKYIRSSNRNEDSENTDNSSSHKINNNNNNNNKHKSKRPNKHVKFVKDKSISGNDTESAIEVSSHIIELPHEAQDNIEDDNSENSDKKVFQMFTISDVTKTSLKDIQQAEALESHSANSMCLPVEIDGQSIGYVLADQGCNRTCVRASALKRNGIKVNEHKLTNQFLLCSSGEEIPIRSRFKATISSKGKTIGDSIVYVVDDKPNADIVCDMVVGRSTLSSGDYNCIDTKKGTLFNKKTGAEIICYPGKIIDTETGRKNIVPKHTSQTHNDA